MSPRKEGRAVVRLPSGRPRAPGGKLEAFYFAFGEHDAYVLSDLPDNESAAAVALVVNSSEAVVLQTIVLLTPEELDAACKKQVDFRPAGA